MTVKIGTKSQLSFIHRDQKVHYFRHALRQTALFTLKRAASIIYELSPNGAILNIQVIRVNTA